MDITTIRNKLAVNIGTVTGLRSSPVLIDNPSPPIALVNLNTVDYHEAMQNGLNVLNFQISLIVGRAAERSAQRKLDAYLAPTGSGSVKAGVESNRTLDGSCFDLIVTSASAIGSLTINDQVYLAAEFNVTVYA